MPWQVVIKARFQRSYDRLSADEQLRVKKSLRQFQEYLNTGNAPIGLGIRKLAPGIYEFRVGIALRCLSVEEGETLFLALLGSHDEIMRFLHQL